MKTAGGVTTGYRAAPSPPSAGQCHWS